MNPAGGGQRRMTRMQILKVFGDEFRKLRGSRFVFWIPFFWSIAPECE
jgi:hypothetical protein